MAALGIKIDWNEVKALFVAGTSPAMIARSALGPDSQPDQENVNHVVRLICTHARRSGWYDMAQRVQAVQTAEHTQNAVIKVQAGSLTDNLAVILGGRRKNYLQKMSQVVEKATDMIDREEFVDHAAASKAFFAHQPIHAVAKDIYGIGKETPGAQISVSIMTGWSPDEPPPAIDVIDV